MPSRTRNRPPAVACRGGHFISRPSIHHPRQRRQAGVLAPRTWFGPPAKIWQAAALCRRPGRASLVEYQGKVPCPATTVLVPAARMGRYMYLHCGYICRVLLCSTACRTFFFCLFQSPSVAPASAPRSSRPVRQAPGSEKG